MQEYQRIQKIAKQVHEALAQRITSHSTEQSIVADAIALLQQHDIHDTWYHNTPAFVLLGSRSCFSISGRDYTPATEPVGQTNVITVDLSPAIGDVWGDCARSFYVEDGICSLKPSSDEFIEGHEMEKYLHAEMVNFVRPNTTFSELFQFGNELIRQQGYVNLDFLGNLGHSIETSPDKRRFIDSQCHETLGSVPLFTFEPHIKKTVATGVTNEKTSTTLIKMIRYVSFKKPATLKESPIRQGKENDIARNPKH